MKKKIKVGIIFGGKSAEHEISLQSAKNVIAALDKEKYEPILIGIDKQGRWLLNSNGKINFNQKSESITLLPQSRGKIVNLTKFEDDKSVDVIFPILHGPFGEDGTVQGLLKLVDIPFVGAGVLGSAIGMDKDIMKRLLRDAGIPIAKFLSCKKNELPNFSDIVKKIGLPFFAKPANLGSSIGINKIKNENEFKKAVDEALNYDGKIIFEEYIKGREIECSVLGNDNPLASLPGEIIPHHEFYSYTAKYLDENGAAFVVPAELSAETTRKIQGLAVKTFKTLCGEGLGRVDFFLKENGDIIVNEINTIPGFTSISMYPRLWEASGISYPELINRLIELAFERFEKEKKLKTSYNYSLLNPQESNSAGSSKELING